MLLLLCPALPRLAPSKAGVVALTDLITEHQSACLQLSTDVSDPVTPWDGILIEGPCPVLFYPVSTPPLCTPPLRPKENLTASVSQYLIQTQTCNQIHSVITL